MSVINFKSLAVLVLSAVSATAFASGSCTTEPKAKWLPEKDVQAKLEKQGFNVKRVKTEGSCYEAYVISKEGKKQELILNPVDGVLVKEEGKS